MTTSSYKFDIHPSVVFRLGDELISDEIQALVELIKNSYDADSTYTRVTIDTKNVPDSSSQYPKSKGYIVVEDDGIGMNKDAIERGWLLISGSSKRNMKEKKLTTSLYNRTPQGDKGLGRLGAQRLGYNLEIFTSPKGQFFEYHVSFTWHDFLNQERLSSVPVQFSETAVVKKPGTRLIISDLRNTDIWESKEVVKRLKASLSRLISPFEKIRNFRVDIKVNGIRIDLAEIAEDVRNSSELRYSFAFDGKFLFIKGLAKIDFFEPQSNAMEDFNRLVLSDNGLAFLNFMTARKKSSAYNIVRSAKLDWYVEFHQDIDFSNIPHLLKDGQEIANPGKFQGEADVFDLDNPKLQYSVFDNKGEYKQYIKELSGIGIYRDGFGIRVDSDWLNLRSGQTSGSSYYVLRPENTLGYISITSIENPQLKETTSREGFIANVYYKNFYSILQRFVKFTNDAQTYMRRSWVDFRKTQVTQTAKVSKKDTSPQGITKEIQSTLATASKYREGLVEAVAQVDNKEQGQESLSRLNQNNLLAEVNKVILYLDGLSERVELPGIVALQYSQLQEQLSLTYETMSLGLTAEALTHEVSNITQQIAERNEQIHRFLRQNNFTEPKLYSYIDYIRNSVSALRRQLSHFTPSLRYMRNKLEDINLKLFLADMSTFYLERFQAKHIQVDIHEGYPSGLTLYMNKGKLTQVFDNLLLNSEYWLEEDIRLGRISTGIISLIIDSPVLTVYDNGRGIDPTVEHTLFDPFITTKQNGTGRGLGLFIVQQLLDSERCTINLSSDRNTYGRLYRFEINLANRIRKDERP